MQITITIDLDMDAYRAKYGPGTEWWAEYRQIRTQITREDGIKIWGTEIEPPEGYEFDKNPNLIEEMIKDCLTEGFYDWHSQGWMKINGEPTREE